jgi:hypothetical protein
MLTFLRRFHHDERGGVPEKLAVVTALVAGISILGAHYLDRMSQSGGLPQIALISPDGSAKSLSSVFASLSSSPTAPSAPSNHFGDIDYSTTGSLSGTSSRPIVLDPCTGQAKQ